MIEDGLINAAIVGTCSLCLNPNVSLQIEGLGLLNNSIETRSYSADGMFIWILIVVILYILCI